MTIDLVKQNRTKTAEPLPLGWYFVGDPCYAFSNDHDSGEWMRWLEDAWRDTDENAVKIMDGTVNGFRIAASGTEHGDGTFKGSDGYEYGVDAGLLGAVPVEAIRSLSPEFAALSPMEIIEKIDMTLVYFPNPFHVEFVNGDTVVIGHISIPTGWAGGDEDGEDEGDIWSDDEESEDDL